LIFALLTLFVALMISSVAAYYSIVGLMAIFAAAKIPIAIMGGVLEIGKLIVASWTFKNWKTSHALIKTYFIISIIILMFITSLGIFGFLSKAHLEQSVPTKPLSSQIEQIQIKIDQKFDDRLRLENTLENLNSAFEKYLELGAVTKGLKAREEFKEESDFIKSEIDALSEEIIELNTAAIKIQNEIDMIEVEVGPIKYIANLLYEDVNSTELEDSVRYIILLLILVFDPLAVVLVIAGNISLSQEFEKRKKIEEEKNSLTVIDENSNERVITQKDILNIKEESETIPIPSDAPENENVIVDESNDQIIDSSGNRWIISQWREKGFKSPRAYISFLKKFG